MTATVTANPRPTIVIEVPKLGGLWKRAKRRLAMIAESIKEVGRKLWGIKPLRYAATFVGGVGTMVVTIVAITVVSLLLALPFTLIGWFFVAELVFLCSYLLAWYLAVYYAVQFALERL